MIKIIETQFICVKTYAKKDLKQGFCLDGHICKVKQPNGKKIKVLYLDSPAGRVKIGLWSELNLKYVLTIAEWREKQINSILE